jgi:hypothetical protein
MPQHGILVDVSSSARIVQLKMQVIELPERFVLQEMVEIVNLPIFPCIHRLDLFTRLATESIASNLKVAYAFRQEF